MPRVTSRRQSRPTWLRGYSHPKRLSMGGFDLIISLFSAAKIGFLNRRDLFVIEGDRRTSVSLFTDEVKFRRRLVTTQTRHALGMIDDLFSALFDLGPFLGDLQIEK